MFKMAAERRRMLKDMERHASILAESVDVAVDPALFSQDPRPIDKFVKKFSGRGRVRAIAVCGSDGSILAGTSELRENAAMIATLAQKAMAGDAPVARIRKFQNHERYAYIVPLHSDSGAVTGALVILQDTAFIRARLADMWRHNFLRLLVQVFLLSLVTLWVIRWNITAPIDQLTAWMRRVRSGALLGDSEVPRGLPKQLASEAAHFAKSLAAARSAAQEEAKLRQTAQALWTPERLKRNMSGRSLRDARSTSWRTESLTCICAKAKNWRSSCPPAAW